MQKEFICYSKNVKHVFTSTVEWLHFGCKSIYHRDDAKPAYILKHDGKIIVQIWIKHGNYHREGDGLAFMNFKDKIFKLYKNDKYYNKFVFKNLINIQIMIKILYFINKNRHVWSPNYLGGKFTKKQLLNLLAIPALP
jgi:hypothetical protein